MDKYCFDCSRTFPGDRKYCDNCGKELKTWKKGLQIGRGTSVNKKRFSPWILVVFFVLIFGVVLFPTKVVSYQVEVPYITTEQYIVEVPYETVEEYVEKVPYVVQETYVESVPVDEEQEYVDEICTNQYLKYNIDWKKCTAAWIDHSITDFKVLNELIVSGESTISITNLDTEGGLFKIWVGYRRPTTDAFGNSEYGKSFSIYINPGSSKTLSSTVGSTTDFLEKCIYKAESIPTKEVCEYDMKTKTVTGYKDVIKIRNSTLYRDDTKYRPVTKIRTETREREVRETRMETQTKRVNWLFEFDALI